MALVQLGWRPWIDCRFLPCRRAAMCRVAVEIIRPVLFGDEDGGVSSVSLSGRMAPETFRVMKRSRRTGYAEGRHRCYRPLRRAPRLGAASRFAA